MADETASTLIENIDAGFKAAGAAYKTVAASVSDLGTTVTGLGTSVDGLQSQIDALDKDGLSNLISDLGEKLGTEAVDFAASFNDAAGITSSTEDEGTGN